MGWTKSESVRSRVDKIGVRAEVWSKRAVSAEKCGQKRGPCGARAPAGAYAPGVFPAREAGDPERVNIGSARTPVLSKRSTRTRFLSTFLRTDSSFVHLSPHEGEFCPPAAATGYRVTKNGVGPSPGVAVWPHMLRRPPLPVERLLHQPEHPLLPARVAASGGVLLVFSSPCPFSSKGPVPGARSRAGSCFNICARCETVVRK